MPAACCACEKRLVANSRFRTQPKTERSWDLRVSEAGKCNGHYERVGAHGNAALYRSPGGAVIFFNTERSCWLAWVWVGGVVGPPAKGLGDKTGGSFGIGPQRRLERLGGSGLATRGACAGRVRGMPTETPHSID